MKKIFLKFIAVLAISIGSFMGADAQVVIKVRPARPVLKVRPVTPGPRHVWVAGDYVLRGGGYVYVDGYWAEPARGYRIWKEGHWKRRPGGWVWIPGRWVR